jgi:hypothetical protein
MRQGGHKRDHDGDAETENEKTGLAWCDILWFRRFRRPHPHSVRPTRSSHAFAGLSAHLGLSGSPPDLAWNGPAASFYPPCRCAAARRVRPSWPRHAGPPPPGAPRGGSQRVSPCRWQPRHGRQFLFHNLGQGLAERSGQLGRDGGEQTFLLSRVQHPLLGRIATTTLANLGLRCRSRFPRDQGRLHLQNSLRCRTSGACRCRFRGSAGN